MRNLAQILNLIFTVVLLISCRSDNIILPTSTYRIGVPEQNINRNIFIKINDKGVFHNDLRINDIKEIREAPEKFTTLNEGSNSFTIVIQGAKNSPGHLVDSLFLELSKNLFLKAFMLTNSMEDSVGILVSLPFYDNYRDSKTDIADSLYPYLNLINDKYEIDGVIYQGSQLEDAIGKINNIGKTILINPSEFPTYQDLVSVLDIMNLVHQKRLLLNSINIYGKQYVELNKQERGHIISITDKEYAIINNTAHNMRYH